MEAIEAKHNCGTECNRLVAWTKNYRVPSRLIETALNERFGMKGWCDPESFAEIVKENMTRPFILNSSTVLLFCGYPAAELGDLFSYYLKDHARCRLLRMEYGSLRRIDILLFASTEEELDAETLKFWTIMNTDGSSKFRNEGTLGDEVPVTKPKFLLPSPFVYMMEESTLEVSRIRSTITDKPTVRSFAAGLDILYLDKAIVLTKDFFDDMPFTINGLKEVIYKNYKKRGSGASAVALDFRYPETERLQGQKVPEGFSLMVGGSLEAMHYAWKAYHLAHGKEV